MQLEEEEAVLCLHQQQEQADQALEVLDPKVPLRLGMA
jgi:hypothetical protein